MDEHRKPDRNDVGPADENLDDADKVESGAASGVIVGTAAGGPIGAVVGAVAGSAVGGAAEAADDAEDEPDRFDRVGQPGDERSVDLQVPRLGGHVGGSDPEHA